MVLDGKKVPLFSTHYSFKNREFLRVGNGEYAEVFVGGFWIECGVLTNAQLIVGNYTKIFWTGLPKHLCNIRLFLIGENYRII